MTTIQNTYLTTELSFQMDGSPVGSFRASGSNASAPLSSATYSYNQSVYAQVGLPNTDHTLVVSSQFFDTPSDILFDYFVYT